MPAAASFGLSAHHVEGLFHATDSAARAGVLFNLFLTIHWGFVRAVRVINDVCGPLQQLFERARHWLAHRGAGWHAVFVHELGDAVIPHTHILLYVPDHLAAAFEAMIPRWIGSHRKRAIDVQALAGRASVDRVLRYLCKGVEDPDVAVRYGICRSEEGQGFIPFKRAGWSQSLGLTARSPASSAAH